jgi:anti-sigma factor RsiW
MKTCEHIIYYLIRHVEGTLGDSESASFHNHLQGCPSCRVRHRDLRQMVRPQSGAECRTCESFLADPGPESGGSKPPAIRLPNPFLVTT